jgi:hypothetical protein
MTFQASAVMVLGLPLMQSRPASVLGAGNAPHRLMNTLCKEKVLAI